MAELGWLRILLLVSLLVVPLATDHGFAPRSARSVAAHLGAWLLTAVGLWGPMPSLVSAWLAFCLGSFVRFLWHRGRYLRSSVEVAKAIPFVFSIIAAVWLAGAANDLRILGYGPAFSFYAALHGNVLGVTLVGALAALSAQDRPYRRFYTAAVFVCFASFLLVALGIDRLALLKPIGVLGLSVTIPAAQLVFLRDVAGKNRTATALAGISLAGLGVTMLLAWRNELALAPLRPMLGVRSMVSVHGVINTVVVAPSMLLAVVLDRR